MCFFQGVNHVNFFLSGSTIKTPFGSGNMERAAINEDVYNNVWRPGNTPEQKCWSDLSPPELEGDRQVHPIMPRLLTGGCGMAVFFV